MISLLVPTLNEEKNIGTFLDDIISQTKIPEVVICDGGSKDKTIEIIKKYQKEFPQIKLIQISEKGTGIAINRAFENSSGDYVLHCGADWRFTNKKLFEIIDKNLDKDILAVFSYIKINNTSLFKNSLKIWDVRNTGKIKMTFIRRNFFQKFPNISYGEDKIVSKKLKALKLSIKFLELDGGFERGNYENFTLSDFIRRYIWYGKTFHLYLKENNEIKEALRIGYCMLCVLFPPLLLISASYGFYSALNFIKKYPPVVFMFPLLATLSTFFMGLGYIKHFFNKELDIGH
ncbi:MAG: glycosyltransferase [Candidatus Micrarchaeia archaeon]